MIYYHKIVLTVTITGRVEGCNVNTNSANTANWVCDAEKHNRGRRRHGVTELEQVTVCRLGTCVWTVWLTKSPEKLLWDTIEPQSTHPMGPGSIGCFPRPLAVSGPS
jgi:hypothetical protein